MRGSFSRRESSFWTRWGETCRNFASVGCYLNERYPLSSDLNDSSSKKLNIHEAQNSPFAIRFPEAGLEATSIKRAGQHQLSWFMVIGKIETVIN